MGFDDVLHDGQPKSAAAGIAGPALVHPVEPLEDAWQVFFGHADAVVGHLDEDLLFHVIATHLGGAVLLAVAKAVGNEVGEDLPDFRGVSEDGQLGAILPKFWCSYSLSILRIASFRYSPKSLLSGKSTMVSHLLFSGK